MKTPPVKAPANSLLGAWANSVPFIVEVKGRVWAIEVKASTNIGPDDLSGLKSFTDFYDKPCEQVVAYLGTTRRLLGKVEVWPWQDLLAQMFAC